jgi:hypothetical protein
LNCSFPSFGNVGSVKVFPLGHCGYPQPIFIMTAPNIQLSVTLLVIFSWSYTIIACGRTWSLHELSLQTCCNAHFMVNLLLLCQVSLKKTVVLLVLDSPYDLRAEFIVVFDSSAFTEFAAQRAIVQRQIQLCIYPKTMAAAYDRTLCRTAAGRPGPPLTEKPAQDSPKALPSGGLAHCLPPPPSLRVSAFASP